MKKLTCVAIDDEPIALSIISEYCSRIPELELLTFTSPLEGMECVRRLRPDILLLDIEMNSRSGLSLARELPEGTCLIFTTAYQQYALEGFNLDAVDFLHKPIFFPRFSAAIDKARRRLNAISSPEQAHITLRVEYRTLLLPLHEILYIEAMDNYVKIHRHGQPTILSQITMKEMEAKLPAEEFLRVHRSFIVPRSAITAYSRGRLSLRDCEEQIPVGRKYAPTLAPLLR